MKKVPVPFYILPLALTALVSGTATRAQEKPPASGAPPKVIQIIREEIKAGKNAPHAKSEAATYVASSRKYKWPVHYLALDAVTGPNEAWYISGYPSFEEFEKNREASQKNSAYSAEMDRADEADSAFLNGVRTVVAVYREDLSYQPNINIGEFRYFEVDAMRIRMGREEDFAALGKIDIEAHQKINSDEHWAAFEAVEGAPSGTIFFFTPMKSLKKMDEGPAHEKQVRDAMGDTNWNRMSQFARDGIITDESNVFAFDPKMSYPAEETVAADPSFWKPKTATASAGGEGGTGGSKATPTKAPAKQSSNKQ